MVTREDISKARVSRLGSMDWIKCRGAKDDLPNILAPQLAIRLAGNSENAQLCPASCPMSFCLYLAAVTDAPTSDCIRNREYLTFRPNSVAPRCTGTFCQPQPPNDRKLCTGPGT